MTGLMAWSNDDSGAIVACFNQEGVGLQGRGESTRGVWVIVTNNLSVDCRGKMWCRPFALGSSSAVYFCFRII